MPYSTCDILSPDISWFISPWAGGLLHRYNCNKYCGREKTKTFPPKSFAVKLPTRVPMAFVCGNAP